jgi:hypothetical protein
MQTSRAFPCRLFEPIRGFLNSLFFHLDVLGALGILGGFSNPHELYLLPCQRHPRPFSVNLRLLLPSSFIVLIGGSAFPCFSFQRPREKHPLTGCDRRCPRASPTCIVYMCSFYTDAFHFFFRMLVIIFFIRYHSLVIWNLFSASLTLGDHSVGGESCIRVKNTNLQ